MALLKENYKNQYGVEELYWRVIGVNLNLHLKFCDITVGGYASQEARVGEAEYMNVRKVRAIWSDDEYTKYFSPRALEKNTLYDNIYEYLKTTEFFQDTVDI